MALTYRAKRNDDHAEGFAVFDGPTYLGDVQPVFVVNGRSHRQRPQDHDGPVARWLAHPAGYARQLEVVDGIVWMPDETAPLGLLAAWERRLDAAHALRSFRASR